VKTRGLLQCKHCRHQTSLTAGTVFAYSKLPLTIWFLAMDLLTQQKKRHLGPRDRKHKRPAPQVAQVSIGRLAAVNAAFEGIST
jgi:hypothetical protein